MTLISEYVAGLQTILSEEEDLYLRMRDLLAREEAELVELDPETIASTVEEKRMLSEEGKLFEESRIHLVAELARALGLESDSLKLSELISALGSEAGELAAVHARLSALLSSTRKLIDANQSFANRSLARVQDTLRLLGRSLPDESNYGPGRKFGTATGRGRLVRQAI